MLTFAFMLSSLPCLYIFWHAIPTCISFYIFDVFYYYYYARYTVNFFWLFQPVKGYLSCAHVQRSNDNSKKYLQFVEQNVRN